MKKLGWAMGALIALALPASAADLPVRMPVKAPPMVPVWSWTGFYIGGNVGYSWGRSKTHVDYFNATSGAAIAPPAGSITDNTLKLNGAIAGGQAGYNWQLDNRWVVGIEGDIQWSGQKGDANFLCATPVGFGGVCSPGITAVPAGFTGTSLSLEQKLEWFGTLRGRLGVTVTPEVLVYATGGLAFGEIKTSGTLSGATLAMTIASTGFSHSETNAGWTVGAGLEARLSGNWTGKIEYLYMDLGSVSGSVTNTPANVRAAYSSDITDHIVRVGVNYKF